MTLDGEELVKIGKLNLVSILYFVYYGPRCKKRNSEHWLKLRSCRLKFNYFLFCPAGGSCWQRKHRTLRRSGQESSRGRKHQPVSADPRQSDHRSGREETARALQVRDITILWEVLFAYLRSVCYSLAWQYCGNISLLDLRSLNLSYAEPNNNFIHQSLPSESWH